MTRHDDYQAAVLALSPAAYWTFQGLAPGALHDVSGNGHDLTGVGGFTVGNAVIGWDGFAYASFDGSSAYFTIGGASLAPTGAQTVMAIVQPTKDTAEIWSNDNAAVTAGVMVAVGDPPHNDGYILRGCTGTAATAVQPQDTHGFGYYGYGYQMVGMVIDPISLTLFVNGSPIQSLAWGVRQYNSGNQPQIGRYTYGGNYFRGAISDLYVLNDAQSLDSIRSLAAITPNPLTPSNQELVPLLQQILSAVTYRGY